MDVLATASLLLSARLLAPSVRRRSVIKPQDRTAQSDRVTAAHVDAMRADWRRALPTLTAQGVMVRNLRIEDARSLLLHLSTDAVARFISPLPASIEDFAHFIHGALEQQEAGVGACFVVLPAGVDQPVGLIQLRILQDNVHHAEWLFAIGSAYWGSGLFIAAAHLVLEFAFATVGLERLEARCVAQNSRGTGALRKLHAVPERYLAASLVVREHTFDQVLWTITRLGYQSRARRRMTSLAFSLFTSHRTPR